MSRRDNILVTPYKRLKGAQCGVENARKTYRGAGNLLFEANHQFAAKVKC